MGTGVMCGLLRRRRRGSRKYSRRSSYEHEYDTRNFDRHRRDALAMERLTKYKSVVDMYGFCGDSALSDFADEGDISDAIWPSDEQEWKQYDEFGKVKHW